MADEFWTRDQKNSGEGPSDSPHVFEELTADQKSFVARAAITRELALKEMRRRIAAGEPQGHLPPTQAQIEAELRAQANADADAENAQPETPLVEETPPETPSESEPEPEPPPPEAA